MRLPAKGIGSAQVPNICSEAEASGRNRLGTPSLEEQFAPMTLRENSSGTHFLSNYNLLESLRRHHTVRMIKRGTLY